MTINDTNNGTYAGRHYKLLNTDYRGLTFMTVVPMIPPTSVYCKHVHIVSITSGAMYIWEKGHKHLEEPIKMV